MIDPTKHWILLICEHGQTGHEVKYGVEVKEFVATCRKAGQSHRATFNCKCDPMMKTVDYV